MKCQLKDLTTAVGVDILSLGGTKIGLMYGEAVLVFNSTLINAGGTDTILKYRHKQAMQLASKQRFISTQFLRLMRNELWKKSSEHSNAMAQLLKKRLETHRRSSSIRFTRPVETNAIFMEIPLNWFETLSSAFPFYQWRTKNCEVRLMCSFDTSETDIENFIEKIDELPV